MVHFIHISTGVQLRKKTFTEKAISASWWFEGVVFWEHYSLTPVLSWLPSRLLSSDRHRHTCDFPLPLSLRGAYSVNSELWMEISNKSKPPTCHFKHFIMVGNDHPKRLAEIKARKKWRWGATRCVRDIQCFDWNWHTLSRAKKSCEICKYIDYTSSAFPRRTQWRLAAKAVVQPLFSSAHWMLHISGALYNLPNGRIFPEAFLIS